MSLEPTLLIQGADARREIAHAAAEALEAAVRDAGGKDPLGRVLDAITCQLGVLTLARVADLLGVTERTVTETYVAKEGLPAHRLHKTASPWFLLDEVVEWVRAKNSGTAASEGSRPKLVNPGRGSFITKDQLRLIRSRKPGAQPPVVDGSGDGERRKCG